jgi:hypothetical protein
MHSLKFGNFKECIHINFKTPVMFVLLWLFLFA